MSNDSRAQGSLVAVLGAFSMVVAIAIGVSSPPPVSAMSISEARQTQLIHQYCAVCHMDARPNGGLSLEHFDAATVDPGDAAMIVSKLDANAMSAAGIEPPSQAEQEALHLAMTRKAQGAEKWSTGAGYDPFLKTEAFTASIVQKLPAGKTGALDSFYRLKLSCDGASGQGKVQLAWSPAVPEQGSQLLVSNDLEWPAVYTVEGTEKMGNGSGTQSGPGSIFLDHNRTLPWRTLAVANLFPDERIEFPLDELPDAARGQLEACFGT